MKRAYEIIGIGAPIIDQILQVSEEYLATLPGRKGGMELIDSNSIDRIIKNSGSQPLMLPGGSGSNVIRGLANFGHSCALIGRIGNDEIGKKFIHGLKELAIQPLYTKTPTATAQVLCLVTPDGQRTFRACMGASQEMSDNDLDPTLFQDVKLVHIEGYALLNAKLAQRAMEYAKAAGAKVSFDLASFEIAESYRDTVVDLLWRYTDIAFANEDETSMLTGVNDPMRGCSLLKDLCKIAVVLLGKKGCWVGHQEKLLKCDAYPVDPVDTTGAGDLFASGFLHGYLSDLPLEVCAHYGALTAAAVVQVLGAEMAPQIWHQLREKISTTNLETGQVNTSQ
jgi:sugar/nucleoside kinase (ribokinase family)